MFGKIMVPIDGSPVSYRALDNSIKVAKKFKSEIILVSIVNTSNLTVSTGVTYMPELTADMKNTAQQYLGKAEQKVKAQDLKCYKIIEEGDPKKILANVIPEKLGIDLIIIGKTGKGAITKWFMGSVARYVSEKSECNVLLVE